MMNNADFWASVRAIIAEGFTPEGLLKLDSYAEQFISGRLVYQRFSPREQHGCAAGGEANVIASLLAGAEDCPDSDVAETLSEFKRERQRGAKQEAAIEQWAKAVGCWTECVDDSLHSSFGEEIAILHCAQAIQPRTGLVPSVQSLFQYPAVPTSLLPHSVRGMCCPACGHYR